MLGKRGLQYWARQTQGRLHWEHFPDTLGVISKLRSEDLKVIVKGDHNGVEGAFQMGEQHKFERDLRSQNVSVALAGMGR